MRSQISLSTWSYLSLPPFKALEKISRLGFKAVELWCDYPHFWPRHYLKKDKLAKLTTALKKFTGKNSIHAPIASLIDKNIGLRDEAFIQFKETITLASKLNIKLVTLHGGKKFPGMQGWDYEKDAFLILCEAINKLNKFAKERKITLCIENVPDEFGFLPQEMSKILKHCNLSVTFDIGHSNILTEKNKTQSFFNLFKNKIRVIHMNDNTGNSDDHLPVGYGNIKFCDFLHNNLKYFKNINFVGEFAFNKKNQDAAAINYMNFMRNFS